MYGKIVPPPSNLHNATPCFKDESPYSSIKELVFLRLLTAK